MKQLRLLTTALFGLVVAACSASDPAPGPTGGNEDKDDTEVTVQSLAFVAPCTADSCGEVPPSLKSAKPTCSASGDSCAWTAAPSDSGSVSYRPCADTECGADPGASVCPVGTTYKGSACGAENDDACRWTSACAPPRSTTPCADADGCGPLPAIGVICSDGSSGELLCMKQGNACGWERSCD